MYGAVCMYRMLECVGSMRQVYVCMHVSPCLVSSGVFIALVNTACIRSPNAIELELKSPSLHGSALKDNN